MERTCVLRAWVVAYYWVSRSRKANLDSPPPARHLSALPTLFGRSRVSPPSLPPFLLPQNEFAPLPRCSPPPPSFASTPFSSSSASFSFFFQPPANLTADNRAITKDCKGEKRGGGGVERIPRNARTRVPRGYPSLFFFLFFSPESNPLCREGCEERKEGVEMKEFFFSSGMRLFLWWRGCFFLRYFLLEKLCCFGIDNRWFWDGVFLSLSTCE